MTRTVPDREGGVGRVTEQAGPADAVTLLLSREVRAGHEQAFEAVLRKLAAEVRRQPGHLDVIVLKPRPGGSPIYTVVTHFARRSDAGAWLSTAVRARLVAEAGCARRVPCGHSICRDSRAGWPRLAPRCWSRPPGWMTALVSAAGILPLLELAGYFLAPRLSPLPLWAPGLRCDRHFL